MMDTSLLAYHEVKPHLADKQATVYALIEKASFAGYDLTDKEMSRVLRWEINTVVPRRRELEKMGLIEVSCVRNCGVTRFMVKAWKVNTK